MSRLSIEVSESQHRQIKALAESRGQTVREFIIARTLEADTDSGLPPEEALARLQTLLEERIAAARHGEVSEHSVRDVAVLARARRNA